MIGCLFEAGIRFSGKTGSDMIGEIKTDERLSLHTRATAFIDRTFR